ncbi:hypothetical protein QFC21_003388 [Naganishia friedmannii]|uniref:Uncharacterized protein n=1 Tax=Naganishia friedmannii TaxID=89922 RepID=A0ACC2VP35_9TREE|nr:hypothetical protein QFC21_003388 [Naganishia friedmannii]
MIPTRLVWLVLPLFARALNLVPNTTSTSDYLISLSDPYRHIRVICLADLNTASCERLPLPPQEAPERACAWSDRQSGSSCIANAIAKTEATLEEKLQDLKESLAQDGVLPDDFLTFEKWKAGQFQVLQDSGQRQEPNREADSIEKTLDVDASTLNIPIAEKKSFNSPIEDSKDTHLRQNTRPPARDNTKTKGEPTPQQKMTPLSPHRYNYASPDCSARIQSASPHSQHASSVLHKSKDRYMLTPCSAKEHWVIIELCDDIRIEAIEIGMFEFFSGIVKEVKLSIGGADDDGDEDQDDNKSSWQEVGSFTGKSVRGTQTFTLDHPTSFQRFIRLDFPSHYGNEYYCPISSIKVYGMNQMEAFKWESRRQKEAEMVRKRLEENAKRGQETGTIAGTILPLITHSVDPSAVQDSTETASQNPTTVTQSPAAASEQIAVPTPLTSMSCATSSHAPASTATRVILDNASPLPTGSSQILDMSQRVANPGKESSSSMVRNTQAPTSTTTFDSPALERSSVTSKTPSTISSSSAVSTDISLKNPKHSASAHGPSRQEARADSSESIYAYIIRRLNDLEGNSTLGMMYMEEQTKATRSILQKLETHLADWKAKINSSQQQAILQERSTFDKKLDGLLLKAEQRETLLERETRSLRSHIRQLREQMAWEQRKTYLHIAANMIIALLIYLGLANPTRSQTGPPKSRSSLRSDEDILAGSRTLPSSPSLQPLRSPSPFDFYPGQASKARVPSYSKLSSRRSSTPILQKQRFKETPSSVQHHLNDQPVVHFNSPESVRLRPILFSSVRLPGPRRLARSAHLHTLSNASRIQNRPRQGFGEEADVNRKSPHRRYVQIESPVAFRPKWVGEEALDIFDDDGLDRGSASEAEDDIDNVVGHTPQPHLGQNG